MTDKFKTLVHSVVAHCPDPRRLGATQLNKICWYADSISFRSTGVPITSETYVKRQRGPVPRSILSILRELEGDGKIAIKEGASGVYKTRLFFSLQEPNTDLLSASEIELVKNITDEICNNHTANSISELSHNCIWEAANDGENLPLVATLVGSPGELTQDTYLWADSVVEGIKEPLSTAA